MKSSAETASLRKAAAIVGVFEHPTRYSPDKSEWLLQAESIAAALDDAGLSKSDVEAYFTVATAPEGGYLRESPASMMADYLNLRPKFVDDTDIGGASFGLHLNRAILGIHAGLFDCAVIGYGACTRSQGVRLGTRNFDDVMGRSVLPFPDSFMEPYGTTIVGYVGMLTARHMHEYGLTREQLAMVAVSARKHASRNPHAVKREPISVADVLASPMIASPVRRLDCCIISDGAAAIVVTSRERALSLRKPPVWILGLGEAIANGRGGYNDWVADHYEMTGGAGEAAYDMSELRPADMDLAMLYDAFTIGVPQQLEALHLCGNTDAGSFIESGQIDLGGAMPVNPDGGGLCSNHPGRRGVFLFVEAVRQLRGEAGSSQVANARHAIVSAMGSAYMGIQGSAVHILGRD